MTESEEFRLAVRLVSAYRYQLQVGREDSSVTFLTALDRERDETAGLSEELHHIAYISRGLYTGQVRRMFRHFGEDAVLVLRFDDLLSSPVDTYERLQNFCGLEIEQLDVTQVQNKTGEDVSPKLSRIARRGAVRQLTRVVPPTVRETVYRKVVSSAARLDKTEIPEVQRASFPEWALERVTNDVVELEKLTGLDLEDWKNVRPFRETA